MNSKLRKKINILDFKIGISNSENNKKEYVIIKSVNKINEYLLNILNNTKNTKDTNWYTDLLNENYYSDSNANFKNILRISQVVNLNDFLLLHQEDFGKYINYGEEPTLLDILFLNMEINDKYSKNNETSINL